METETIPINRTRSRDRGQPETTSGVPTYTPLTDIYETDSALILLVEMPGVDIEAVNVTLDNHVLTISGQMRHDSPTAYSLSHEEFREARYERAFSVPEAIGSENIQAVMANGVLKLMLAKAGPRPAKKIAIRPG